MSGYEMEYCVFQRSPLFPNRFSFRGRFRPAEWYKALVSATSSLLPSFHPLLRHNDPFDVVQAHAAIHRSGIHRITENCFGEEGRGEVNRPPRHATPLNSSI